MSNRSERQMLRVFFDTSVVLAGAFSRKGASYILLQLVGLTLLDGRISPEVRIEAERNTALKLPSALPALRVLLNDVLTEGAAPTQLEMSAVSSNADSKDVPILAAAISQACDYLVTLNERDFWPDRNTIVIISPGDLLQEIRRHIHAIGT